MKILLDARLYGLENAGLGRYLMNLVTELSKLDSSNQYILLLRKKYFEKLELPSNWEKVLADFHHYGVVEQIKLPLIINSLKPDICHFPHFNVPLILNTKYIVTIHDMLMHKFNGLSATTLPAPLYFFKQFIYKTIFARAVFGAQKVIVPSNAVKNELIEYYKIDSKKMEVIYEG